MKEEFKNLYDYIIHSEDEEKMHVLGKVTKSMMHKFIDNYPQQAREYLDMLQSVKWHNYLTDSEADRIVSEMMPKPSWTRTVWEGMMGKFGYQLCEEPCYNKNALFVTMCMISSDSSDTIMNMLSASGVEMDRERMFDFIYHLALDKLKDKDKVYDIRNYFKL